MRQHFDEVSGTKRALGNTLKAYGINASVTTAQLSKDPQEPEKVEATEWLTFLFAALEQCI